MNTGQLHRLGIPQPCINTAIRAIQVAADSGLLRQFDLKKTLRDLVAKPDDFVDDGLFGELAHEMVDYGGPAEPPRQIEFPVWGAAGIDEAAIGQMRQACTLPVAAAGALMPDAHVGYGLPIGGVLATRNAVVPYAVGVDIACRMKLSVLDMPAWTLTESHKAELYDNALEKGTRFGVGGEYKKPLDHAVMEGEWHCTRITRENKDKAWRQLGTSGSGNHFAEFGKLTLDSADEELGLAAGEYVALLTHSGSRGAGAAVCSTYSNIARVKLPKKFGDAGRLAWLDLDDEAGAEYWAAMNLMGDYAAANHDVIHRQVSKLLGAQIIAGVENHHNFAWKEKHNGEELIVHRKGATPAAAGELGVIPGSMADPAFIVRGKGNASSLNSASHGAGRQMSRTAALSKYTWKAVQKDLARRGVRVLSAGADEVPGVYKNILDVMREQADLVDVVGRFDPKIVKMNGDGSRAED
jgi:tRNA-splicing ligase RtcB